jgi:endonuclease YncB( thermonuclease family)
MRAVLVLALLAASSAALADFTGRVVKVSDGDTLTVLVNKRQIRVRLEAIDAPELKKLREALEERRRLAKGAFVSFVSTHPPLFPENPGDA